MNIETQTALLSELATACKTATELFGDAGLIARKANAIGAISSGFDAEAFAGTLTGLTAIDAAAVFTFLSQLETLINSEATIGGQTVVLGSALLKFGLASR